MQRTTLFVCVFVCLFVGIKPEKLHSTLIQVLKTVLERTENLKVLAHVQFVVVVVSQAGERARAHDVVDLYCDIRT